jgi:hypothetical protein
MKETCQRPLMGGGELTFLSFLHTHTHTHMSHESAKFGGAAHKPCEANQSCAHSATLGSGPCGIMALLLFVVHAL